MAQSLPTAIPRRDLIAAMDDLDGGLPDGFRQSTGYDVVYHGRRYPPKAVVALAVARMSGRTPKAREFRGGLGTTCVRILQQAGFTVVAKADADPHAADLGGPVNEGARTRVEVNRYERDPVARRRCVAHYGARCVVCELDFESQYGALGRGFIHVHHLRPLSAGDGPTDVDPVRDLRPGCPNCHAMLHRQVPPLTPETLRDVVTASGARSHARTA